MRTLLPLALLLALLAAAPAQRDAKVPDPDPEIERRSFQLADGFEANLFAADPLLAKPIHMNFDAAGRLWLACSETYPQIKPGQQANDKVLILEDTRGQGKADKVTVFASGLLIPTGVEPGDGGAYVANSTELLHLSDPKNTGQATQKRVVLSGFGTEDTHHILHTLRWGHDGNLYFNQSVYIHSHIETPHGPRRLNAGGVWQFRPASQKLEVFVRGLWNSWGHHFDRWGQSFLTDGAGHQGVYVAFPGAGYDPSPGLERSLRGLNPGHPKYCGLEIVSGRHLPDDWQGDLITNDFRAHRVCRFKLEPNGAGYVARPMPDVIKATHPAFRPIDVKMGPDGAIYIADWYNPIIQHGEVDFRDPRRDVTRGRIWRVTAKKRPLVKRPELVKAKAEELCKQLEAPEGWTRHFARRVLAERGAKAVTASLKAWAEGLDAKAEAQRLEALWTYQSLDVVEARLLRSLLEAKDARVRAAAVRVLSAWHERVEKPLDLLTPRVADENAQVRLEAVRALGQIKETRAAELALRVLARPTDEFLDYGLWLTLRELEAKWLPALEANTFAYGEPARLAVALQAVGSARAVPPLVKLLKGGQLSGEAEDGVLVLLAGVGGTDELALVLARAAGGGTRRKVKLLAALEEAARLRRVKPPGELKALAAMLKTGEEDIFVPAARLAGLWKLEAVREVLEEVVADARARPATRRAAIDGLASLGGAASRKALAGVIDKADAAMARHALRALAGLDLGDAATRAVAMLATLKSGEGADEIADALLGRKGGDAALARALSGKKLPADAARVALRAARVSGRPSPPLLDALSKAGDLTARRELSAAERKALLDDVARKGDAARGERVYRRAELLCQKCHAIGGAGGQVGPDLSTIGAAAQADYLLDALLEPSKAIKEGYHSVLITTRRGRQVTGVVVRSTPQALTLRDADDREVVVPAGDIEERTPSKTSLMPQGLTDSLTRGELADLVRFLAELGKGPWLPARERVARRWQVLQPTREVFEAVFRKEGLKSLAGPAKGLTWEPAYATVGGELPLAELARVKLGKDQPELSVVRVEVEMAKAGKATLKIAEVAGVTAWLDGEALPLRAATSLVLTRGTHLLTLAIDHTARKAALKLEVDGARFVAGK